MKKLLLIAALAAANTVFAHQPYISTLVAQTDNSRTAILSGYAEEALNSEAALKKANFTVVDPDAQISQVSPETQLKSITAFDLALPKEGTYKITSTLSHGLKYAFYDQQWRMFVDRTADKVPAKKDREYVIPSDFKATPETIDVNREWTIQSYISKKHTSEISETALAPIDVTFTPHPNNIKVNQDVVVHAHDHAKNLHLANFQVSVRKLGQSDAQEKSLFTNKEGEATLRFPTTGQYLVVVSPKLDLKVKPTTQYYTIVSLHVGD